MHWYEWCRRDGVGFAAADNRLWLLPQNPFYEPIHRLAGHPSRQSGYRTPPPLTDELGPRKSISRSPESEKRNVVQAAVLGAGHVGREDLHDEHLGEELDPGR